MYNVYIYKMHFVFPRNCFCCVDHSIHPLPPPPPPNIWGDLSINFAYIIWGLRCDVNFWGDLLFWGVLHSLYGSGG